MIIDVSTEFRPLVSGLAATLPERIIDRVSSIREGENIGNGQTDPEGNIIMGFTQNPVYDVELLAHEIGHAFEEKLSLPVGEEGDFEMLCVRADIFAIYAVYGESLSSVGSNYWEKLKNANNYLRMSIHFGKRPREKLEPLYRLIRDYYFLHRNPATRWPERHKLCSVNVPFEILSR